MPSYILEAYSTIYEMAGAAAIALETTLKAGPRNSHHTARCHWLVTALFQGLYKGWLDLGVDQWPQWLIAAAAVIRTADEVELIIERAHVIALASMLQLLFMTLTHFRAVRDCLN